MDDRNKGDKSEACRRLEMSLESWGQRSGQLSIAVRKPPQPPTNLQAGKMLLKFGRIGCNEKSRGGKRLEIRLLISFFQVVESV